MGGGKKKLTVRQMTRIQERKEKERGERKSGGSAAEKKKSIGIIPPDFKSGKVVGELKKMKALTPYTVASRFDLRLSVARDFLEELEQRGIVEYVSGSKNLKIYKPLN